MRFSIARLVHQVMLPRAPSPPACGPSPTGLFSHRLWLLGLLLLTSSVLVGCELTAPTGGWGPPIIPPIDPPPPTPPPPPSSDMIAFASNRDGNFEIYVMNADRTNVTRLTDNPAADRSAAWSPDSTQIAFDSTRDGRPEIYVMNADGSNPTRLTSHPAGDTGPAWSPDGTKIAFTSDRDGDAEICVMNADGTGPVNLTTNPASADFGPSWRP